MKHVIYTDSLKFAKIIIFILNKYGFDTHLLQIVWYNKNWISVPGFSNILFPKLKLLYNGIELKYIFRKGE